MSAPQPEISNREDSTPRESTSDSEIQESRETNELDAESSEAETLWQNAVGEILDEDGSSTRELKELICHLIDVFLTHALHQHIWILNPATFRLRLIKKLCSQALLYSICALSLKFSRHPSATSHGSQAYRDQFVKSARCETVFAPNYATAVDRIQCLAVLAAYETGEANGKQAWLDISAASSLIQVASISKSLTSDDYESIGLVRLYLSVLERQLCIGNGLTPSISVFQPSKIAASKEGERSSIAYRLSEMLDLFISIQKFSTKPLVDERLPWSVDSEFMNHREALDRFLITHGNEFEVEPENLDPNADEEDLQTQIENIHCSLAWHCCIIILNRTYLPMPLSSETRRSSATAMTATYNPPLAPEPFLKERREACESSASIISGICRNALACELFFLPMFMGYCCFHSSVVLIHRLKCARSSEWSVIDELKVNFTLLGAMRKFYEPAHEWVEVLFDLHQQPGLQRECADPPISDLFPNYFSRFKDIQEPHFVPLDPPQRLRNSSRLVTPGPTPAEEYVNGTRERPPTTRLTAQATWLTQYRSSLQSHILDIDHDHLQINGNRDLIPIITPLADQPPTGTIPSTTPLPQDSSQGSNEQIVPHLEPLSATIAAEELPIPSRTREVDERHLNSYQERSSNGPEELSYLSQVAAPSDGEGVQLASQISSSYQYPQENGLSFTTFLEFGDKMYPTMPYPSLLSNLDWLQETSDNGI